MYIGFIKIKTLGYYLLLYTNYTFVNRLHIKLIYEINTKFSLISTCFIMFKKGWRISWTTLVLSDGFPSKKC